MSTTLTNGLKLPNKGSVDWYADMQNNYSILDGAVGTIAEHTSALSGKAPLVHTHSKSDITDLFNSANTWSGEQTFSQTIQGNAATASAFDTAKSITLTGAVTGTVSGTNSWKIATVLKTGTAFTGGTVPAPYFKIASWEVAPNTYFGAILQIQNKCYPQNTATLTISVRTKTDATFQRGYSFLNNAIGCLPSEFILCYKEVTGKVLCELYYYTTVAFNGIRFSVISEGIQNDSSLFNTMVVYQGPAGIAALPSDYTVIQTTIGTYTQDFIPYSNNTYDLGSSTNQWKSIYAQSYFYNGTAWGLDKANEWTGENTFSAANLFRKRAFTLGDNSSQIVRMEYKDTNNSRWGILSFIQDTNNTVHCDIGVHALKTDGQTVLNKSVTLLVKPDNSSEFKPINDKAIDLGTSTNKWKTLNGINPGALSLPDYDRFEPIDFSQWDVNLGFGNTYTPSEDGWLHGEIVDSATNSIYLYAAGLQPVQNVYRKYGVSAQGNGSQNSSVGRLAVMMPVRKNVQYRFLIKASSVNEIFAIIFYPCVGNV